jgi:putative protein kinase ArgK-like GTPase of G3E family
VIATEGTTGKNLDKLYESVGAFVEHAKSTGTFEEHRRKQISKKVMAVLQSHFKRDLLEQFDDNAGLDKIVDDIINGKANPFQAGEKLYQEFEKKNRPGRDS